MVIDITEFFVAAREKIDVWTNEEFFKTLQKLEECTPNDLLPKFDYAAGEWWASIFQQIPMHQQRFVALIHFEMPIIIYLQDVENVIQSCLPETTIVLLPVDNMSIPNYTIEPALIPIIFPNNVWASEVDPLHFSIKDLLWTTIV